MKSERLGGINTNAVRARKAAEQLGRERLYGLGLVAMDAATVDPAFQTGSRKLMDARYAVGMARIVGQHPDVVQMPEGMLLNPSTVGSEAMIEIGRHLAANVAPQNGL